MRLLLTLIAMSPLVAISQATTNSEGQKAPTDLSRLLRRVSLGKMDLSDPAVQTAYNDARNSISASDASAERKQRLQNAVDSFEKFTAGQISTSKGLCIAINCNRPSDLKFFLNNKNIASASIDGYPVLLYALQNNCSPGVIKTLADIGTGNDSVINHFLTFPGDYQHYYLSPLTKACLTGDSTAVNSMMDAGALFLPEGLTDKEIRHQARFLWTQFSVHPHICALIERRMPTFPNPEKERAAIATRLWQNMVLVEPKKFTMGCDNTENDCFDAWPPVQIALKTFYIGKYEITRRAWSIIMGESLGNGACADCPADGISWPQVQKFIKRLNKYSTKKFRLPSEPEWEFAASGGRFSHGYTFAGGNGADSVAWTQQNTTTLQPVGKKMPNELGIYDMSGNAAEWCNNAYFGTLESYRYSAEGTVDGVRKVIRGGSCVQPAGSAKVKRRSSGMGENTIPFCGFRLAALAD